MGIREGNGNTPAFLPGESHGQRNLARYSPWGHKQSHMTEQLTQKYISTKQLLTVLFLGNYLNV